MIIFLSLCFRGGMLSACMPHLKRLKKRYKNKKKLKKLSCLNRGGRKSGWRELRRDKTGYVRSRWRKYRRQQTNNLKVYRHTTHTNT